MGEDVKELQQRAWDAALNSFGTAAIFEERARSLKVQLNALKVLGIVLPVLVGSSAATFGANWAHLDKLIYATGAVGIVQLVWTSIALAMGWDDRYAGAKEAQAHNTRLSDDYKKAAERLTNASPDQASKLEQRLELLDVERGVREQLDLKADISKAEKRLGMRAALFQFQRVCATCKTVPTPSRPTNCETCGT